MSAKCFYCVTFIILGLHGAMSFRASIGTRVAFRPQKSQALGISKLSKCRIASQIKLFGEVSTTGNVAESQISPLDNVLDKATNLFPLWVLSFSIIGSLKPSLLTWFSPFITPALALTMVCMGMTLTVADFQRVFKTPQFVLLGFLAQYTIMPLSAALISKVFKLGPALSAGVILVGCAPGGTASNLVTMIAKADLALSVLMTAASTVAAVVMTPFLTSKLAGSYVSVKAADLVVSTLNVVLAPVIAGLGLNTYVPGLCKEVSKYTHFLSVLLVSMICGTVAASNSGVKLGVSAFQLVGAIVSLHLSGFLFGYGAAKLLDAGEARARTIRLVTVRLTVQRTIASTVRWHLELHTTHCWYSDTVPSTYVYIISL